MKQIEIWNMRTELMFKHIELGKRALEKLGYVENNDFDDHGGNTVVTRGDEKMFNTTGAFFVGVYLGTMNFLDTYPTDISEFDLDKVLTIFDSFFWAGDTSAGIKGSIEKKEFWDEEQFEEEPKNGVHPAFDTAMPGTEF